MTEAAPATAAADSAHPAAAARRGVAEVSVVVTVSLAALVVALTFTGGAPQPAPQGLPDSGLVSGWAAPVLRVLLDVAAVGVVGSLLAAVFLVPSHPGELSASARRTLRAVALLAAGWSAVSLGSFASSTSQALGRSIDDVLRSPGTLSYGLELPEGRALVALWLVSLTVALNARSIRTRLGGQVLLLLAVVGMFAPLLTGHAASADDHYWATQAMLVHVLGATFWVGGLLGLMMLRDHADLPWAAQRFSAVAFVCYVAVAVSGTAAAALQLGGAAENLLSAYGALVLAKVAALLALGVVGWMHRRRTLRMLAAGRHRAFLRLAVAELAVMAGAVGAAVALSRTALPPGALATAGATHGGPTAAVRSLPPIDLATLLSQWRPDAVVVTVLVVAAGAYLRGVRFLRSTGVEWPRGRTVSMMSALVLALLLLCSGVATYASAMLSVQSAQVLTLAVTTPILVTAGRPVLLARSCYGQPTGEVRSGWLRAVADPVNGLAALLAVLTLLYATPLLGISLRDPGTQLAVGAVAMLGGFLFFWPLLGLDWVPSRHSAGDRFVLSLFSVVLSSVVLVVLVRSGSDFERTWFEDLHLRWCDYGADRQGAAVVAVAHIGVLLGVSVWLGIRASADRLRRFR